MNGTLNGKRQASSSTYLPCLDAWVTSWFLSILFLIHLPFSFPASPCSPAAPASPVVICVSCGRRAGLDLAAFRRKLHRFPSLPPTSNHNTITDFKATAETQALNHNVVNVESHSRLSLLSLGISSLYPSPRFRPTKTPTPPTAYHDINTHGTHLSHTAHRTHRILSVHTTHKHDATRRQRWRRTTVTLQRRMCPSTRCPPLVQPISADRPLEACISSMASCVTVTHPPPRSRPPQPLCTLPMAFGSANRGKHTGIVCAWPGPGL
ncbi:hypothetical protein CABS01_07664 [Colletotrichum abscissum]|uniref:Uncharacterized protein n=1 Tax=Colletotrichum costaricense TaxID=1209916 RepID=A0AAJ0DSC9_9PEZI|nr:uncharacterized protein CCOS01_16588 [Colletotrichum costaricense]XP_060402526.1 uncharacterized protein CABS01_07664 [Colletotrichum abscissum]KAK1505898.1 hypothetical protein CCOS01_16588 [Colletotrichum costaricense]KAK1509992.1 hypothetical protein CABS01_07664 [Colletotrichum abscissum]